MYLTKSSVPVIGWVAVLLGFVMNGIFMFQSAIGLENIGLSIILFTIIIYLLLTPLTIQQQKFSRLSAKVNPEIQAIQKKYRGKNDQVSMQKQNEEIQATYAKYGLNPMGSCGQMLIQMPILFALYQVIWNIPAYVDKVQAVFTGLADSIFANSAAMQHIADNAAAIGVKFNLETAQISNIIDALYKFKPAHWADLAAKFPEMADAITQTQTKVDHMNYFLGLNIADSPMNIIRDGFASGKWLLLIGAVLVPVLAALSQWISSKLMMASNPSSNGGNGAADQMAQSMKTMNTVMPLMSAFFCLTLPVGMGIYWIIGAVVRTIQQIFINKKIDNMDMEELMKKNIEKMNKKREKQGLSAQKINENATMTTRNIQSQSSAKQSARADLARKAASEVESPTVGKKAKAGSLASKAMMVQDYNEKNSKR